MLDLDSAAEYLRGLNLFDPQAVRGGVTVTDVTRRNRNLRVEAAPGVGYFLKQPDGASVTAAQTLRLEAAFYTFCRREWPAGAARLLPRLVHYDDGRPLLVLELLHEAVP